MEHSPLSLSSVGHYKQSSLLALKEQIQRHFVDLSLLSVEDLNDKVNLLNAYPNLKHLKEPSKDSIFILDDDNTNTDFAEQVVLDGEFFFEHACAGEASRLGLGTKYLLNLKDFSLEDIHEMMVREDPSKIDFSLDHIKELCGGDPKDLKNISLGTRHMLQLAFDIKQLAKKHDKDFKEVINKQSLLIILNESTSQRIISEFIKYNFFFFNPKKVFFMVQQSFHGVHILDGDLSFDEDNLDNKRLHNHGQMYMQKTHDDSIFYVEDNQKHHLSSQKFEEVLKTHKDLLSYNIEDIAYLTGSIDWNYLAFSLELGKKGFDMVMEIVSQNPLKPQKGGAAFFDPVLGKNVMIESNRLLNIRNEEIKYLNKNHNHYPNPVNSFRKVKDKGLHLHFTVKSDKNNKHYLYPCPPQGDINFLVDTAFIMRKDLKPIQNWKSPATTPPTIKAMFAQDRQLGFLDFAKSIIGDVL